MTKKDNPEKSSAKKCSLSEELYLRLMENPAWKRDWEELLNNPIIISGPDTPERKNIIGAFAEKYPHYSDLLNLFGSSACFSRPPVVTIPYRGDAVWEPDPGRPGEFNAVGEDRGRNLFPVLPARNWIKVPSKAMRDGGKGRFLLVAVDLTDGMDSILGNFHEVVRFYRGEKRIRVGKTAEAVEAALTTSRKKREEIKGTKQTAEQEKRKRRSKAASESRKKQRGNEILKKYSP